MQNKIEKMVELLNKSFGDEHTSYYFTEAKKYFKVWYKAYNSVSIYAFIDREGNIYKPAGLNAPAKHIRGTVENPLECCERYSVKYLR